MESESHAGTVGWGLLVAGVVAWDVLAPQTLSAAYDRYLEHPVKRVLAIGAVAITGAHLLNILPPRYDVVHHLADFIERQTSNG